jgi:hypothetical protein
MAWKSIESAPTITGTRIRCKRVVNGETIHEGEAEWRTQSFRDGYVATGWMHPDKPHKVPVPTHWWN